MIYKNSRVIQTVGKHIVAGNSLAGGGVGVSIDESTDSGIVISALEIIEPGLGIVVIAAVAEGVDICVGAGGLDGIAVGIVLVVGRSISVDIHQPNYIALQVRNVVVNSVVITGCIALPQPKN